MVSEHGPADEPARGLDRGPHISEAVVEHAVRAALSEMRQGAEAMRFIIQPRARGLNEPYLPPRQNHQPTDLIPPQEAIRLARTVEAAEKKMASWEKKRAFWERAMRSNIHARNAKNCVCYRSKEPDESVWLSSDARAHRLLWKMLSRKQRRTLKNDNYFEVMCKGGVTNYLIGRHSDNVIVDPDTFESLCVVVDASVPVYDQLAAQMMMLRSEPRRVWRVDDWSPEPRHHARRTPKQRAQTHASLSEDARDKYHIDCFSGRIVRGGKAVEVCGFIVPLWTLCPDNHKDKCRAELTDVVVRPGRLEKIANSDEPVVEFQYVCRNTYRRAFVVRYADGVEKDQTRATHRHMAAYRRRLRRSAIQNKRWSEEAAVMAAAERAARLRIAAEAEETRQARRAAHSVLMNTPFITCQFGRCYAPAHRRNVQVALDGIASAEFQCVEGHLARINFMPAEAERWARDAALIGSYDLARAAFERASWQSFEMRGMAQPRFLA